MMKPRPDMKVSALGWLCVYKGGTWVPFLKLSDEELRSYKELIA